MNSFLLLAPIATVLWALSVRSYPTRIQKIQAFEQRRLVRIWQLIAGASGVFLALCLVTAALYETNVGALLAGVLCLLIDVALFHCFLKRDTAERQ